MTGKEAMEFYYSEYRRLRLEACGKWSEPVVQKELNIQAFQSLVDKIKSDMTLELAEKYLNQ